jgi:hypothetical protein
MTDSPIISLEYSTLNSSSKGHGGFCSGRGGFCSSRGGHSFCGSGRTGGCEDKKCDHYGSTNHTKPYC